MSIIPFDSLAYARALEEAGMPRAQAEALGRQQQKTVEDIASAKDVARREDIDRLAARMNEQDNKLAAQMKEMDVRLTGRIAELDARLTGQIAELDTRLTLQMKELETRLSGKIAELDTRLTTQMEEKIAAAKYDLLRWIVGTGISIVGVMLALAIGAFTVFAPYLEILRGLAK